MQFLHSGQTGVERGAVRAAMVCGIEVIGRAQPGMRDELGPIPEPFAKTLTPIRVAGSRAAVHATLEMATAVLLFTRDTKRAAKEVGASVLIRAARARSVPMLVVDPSTDPIHVAAWLAQTTQPLSLLVTGPRATRWPEGGAVAFRIVSGVVSELIGSAEVTIPVSQNRAHRCAARSD